MKKIGMVTVFCTVCLVLSNALMSCASYNPASKADLTYSETVNVPRVSAADLYTKVNLWFTDTFKGPPEPNLNISFNVPWEKSRIISADKDKGDIKANFTFFIDEKDWPGVYAIVLIYNTVEVQVSDGQYRLVFSNPRNAGANYVKDEKVWNYNNPSPLMRRYVEATHKVWNDLALALRETIGGTVAGK
jgi:hypothetical protein